MSKVVPHKHKASDIVETEDDYLIPHLRSLRDPSKIERAIIEGSEPLPEGTAFPTEPYDNQFFRLTQDIEGYYKGLHRYDGEADEWIRLTAAYLGSGTSNPTSGMINGDTFYRTDLKLLYTYNGTSWAAPVTRSHDALTDVGSSDHHSVFTSSQHANVEHLASMLNQAIQPYNSNITFARKSGSEHNAITYTAGEIKFQDGTARSITPAGELTGLSLGDNYIYFKLDSASLFNTTSHSEAISADRGILAIIIVASASDPDVPCAIQPFYAKGLNVTADTMAVTLLSAISAYLGNVEIADGRIILGDTGIIGRDAGENVRFYIGTDGRAYFAAGDIALDEDGMNVNSGTVIIDTGGIKIRGQSIFFQDSAGNPRGWIYGIGGGTPYLQLGSLADLILSSPVGEFIELLVGGNSVKFNPLGDIVINSSFDALRPSAARTVDLGTPTYPFRYFVPATALGSRPAASADVHGLKWIVTAAGVKDKEYVCLKNDADNYEWVQTGVST